MRLPEDITKISHNGRSGNGNESQNHQNGNSNSNVLPIELVRQDLVEYARQNDTLIVMGETGSGKSTKLPQFLQDARLFHGMVACTQPRRIAAISLATRVAKERTCELGSEVGYSVRFDDKTSPQTRIKYMTDGMLLREAQTDSSLSRYGCIILDEAHERTVNTDILFGIVKNAQQRRAIKSGEKRLKVAVMSATMDVDHFERYFRCKVVYITGRTFPIQVRYSTADVDDYLGTSISTVLNLHQNVPMDEHFLVFLTGQEEIDTTVKVLKESLQVRGSSRKMEVLPLYASLSQQYQEKVFKSYKPNIRRVIVSTNIAETSLTIPGIRHVIDSGRVKQKQYIANTGMQLLKVCFCSRAQIWQRAGRAGRESSGNVYRLFSSKQFESMSLATVPEIQRSPLSTVCLQLLHTGVKKIETFPFIDPPPPAALRKALDELVILGMVVVAGSEFHLTEVGKKAAKFPLEPRLSKALLISSDLRCSEEVITIAAMLSTEKVFVCPSNKKEEAKQSHQKFHSADGDLITMLNAYKGFRKANGDRNWAHQNFLSPRHLSSVMDVRKQLREIFISIKLNLATDNNKTTAAIREAFARGMFMNCAELKPDGRYQEFGQNLQVKIHPSSVLFGAKPPFILFNELIETNNVYARDVSSIEPEWVLKDGASWFKTKRLTA